MFICGVNLLYLTNYLPLYVACHGYHQPSGWGSKTCSYSANYWMYDHHLKGIRDIWEKIGSTQILTAAVSRKGKIVMDKVDHYV